MYGMYICVSVFVYRHICTCLYTHHKKQKYIYNYKWKNDRIPFPPSETADKVDL